MYGDHEHALTMSCVLCCYTLSAAVTQFYRVLKPNGVVYITLWGTLAQVLYMHLTSNELQLVRNTANLKLHKREHAIACDTLARRAYCCNESWLLRIAYTMPLQCATRFT
jgi:hypothetical protein